MQKTSFPEGVESLANSHPFTSNEYYYQQLIQTLPVAIYTCNAQGFISFFNKAAISLWGRIPEPGTDLWCGSWKIFQADGTPVPLDACPMALTLKEGRSIRGIEIVVERPDGIRRNILPHPDPIFNEHGDLIGAVNMLVDITEHKQTKEANLSLKQYNDQLEQFAYAASHDLQEPLRKIQVFSNLLLERNEAQLDEQGKKYLTKISQSTSRMNSIVQDLLEYSKETKPYDQFTPIDLNVIIEDIKSDLELMISIKEAHITCDRLPVIKGAPSQINRLFYNLIQNALKFSKPGMAPVINISVGDNFVISNDRSFFEVRVRDNGIGFDQKYTDRIFHLFQRLNERALYDGNGIGLSLCKKIVEMHHGQITAQSQEDKGACFSIQFPAELLV